MANRPVFIPDINGPPYFIEKKVDFKWFPGLSLQQKQRSIAEMHREAFTQHGLHSVLEISSKSTEKTGVTLSAFNLILNDPELGKLNVEVAFQGSKVFRDGGPFTDLYRKTAREAKRDPRIKESGNLIFFQFRNEKWRLEPKTAFYDWLYLSALVGNPDHAKKLLVFEGFTDIEFNPKRSINCQARSAAMYVALSKRDLLDEALLSKGKFLSILWPNENGTMQMQLPLRDGTKQ
ncbi:MAG: hypothetical protein R3293_14840 [Candidatus Promineifilaceae bacterium]|nr:hypothetical protein [Candidatus Promineifilaceae bacterium]